MEWLTGLSSLFGDGAHMQVVQMGFFFTLAAFIHGKQVKNEIRTQFTSLTAAISKMALAMEKHSERLDMVEREVGIIKSVLNQPKETT